MNYIKIKTVLFFFVAILGACSSADDALAETSGKGYLIEGKFKNKDGVTKIVLSELLPEGLTPIDSTGPNEDGTFRISGKTTGRSFYLLRFNGGDIPLYLDSASVISISIGSEIKGGYNILKDKNNQQIKELVDMNHEHLKLVENFRATHNEKPSTDSAMKAVMAEWQNLTDVREKKLSDFIKNNKPCPAGIFCTLFMMPGGDKDLSSYIRENVKFFEEFNSRYGKEYNNSGFKHFDLLKNVYESVSATAIGAIMPDFTLQDTAGKNVSLTSLRGKYVLVDFWASWCGPCRAENPNVVSAYKKFHSKGFEILGVSLDQDINKWKKAIAKDGLTWTHISDLKGWQSMVCKKFNVASIPFSILLDKDGRIIGTSLRGEELHKKLSEIYPD